MIFTKLTVENFGLFAGRQDFFLRPQTRDEAQQRRPIILLGGMNGAGKTTFFEAIKLCLYGQLALGNRVKAVDYENYLIKRVHRNPKGEEQVNSASIKLEFEHAHAGKTQNYRLQRSWQKIKSGVDESLSLWRDGNLISDLEPSHWQDFIKELVPPGIAQLFFFDGERIQSLAEDEDDLNLADSIKSLLGLDLVDSLHSDLAIYLRKQKQKMDQEGGSDLENLQAEIVSLEEDLAACQQDRAQLTMKIDHLTARIERQEQRIASAGGQFAKKRNAFKTQRAKLEAKIDQMEIQIRELAEGLLPFALTPGLCKALREQLLKEEEFHRWESSVEYLKSQQNLFEDTLTSDEFWDDLGLKPTKSRKDKIRNRIDVLIQNLETPPAHLREVDPLHQLSPHDQQRILGWLDETLATVPNKLQKHTQQLESLIRERQQVERDLKRAPADEALKPLLADLSQTHKDLNALRAKAKGVDEQKRRLESRLDELNRTLSKAVATQDREEQSAEALQRAAQVQRVLEVYSEKLRKVKVKELSQAVTECFNKLSHKQDWINHIVIDPETFSVTLYGHENQPLLKSSLSAGEKQIYAIAMLWGLGIASGRPLPVIIDTPLGRLDSAHRRQLVENYFPYASHQMLLLSTDTEVDHTLFEALEPHISNVYHLEFDSAQARTRVSETYFWSPKMKELTHAT